MTKIRVAKRPACFACRHYYVTWDPGRPYGCRVLGFKSRIAPNLIVRQTTPGMNCQWFSFRGRKTNVS